MIPPATSATGTRTVLPSGLATTYLVDAETWLPARVLADVTVDGTEYHPGRNFSDYEKWDGFAYPRSVGYWWLPDAVETATVEAVEIDVHFGEDRFAIPADLM